LAENVLGVMHNLKSSLMAVNGFLDLLAAQACGGEPCEAAEQAKVSVRAVETILGDLAFGLRAIGNHEPGEISLNACVRSTVALLQSNRTFRSKVKFSFEFTAEDRIHAVPAEVMRELDAFVTGAAKRILARGEYRSTVSTVADSGYTIVQIGGEEISFPVAPT
jgi:hypothetical protein